MISWKIFVKFWRFEIFLEKWVKPKINILVHFVRDNSKFYLSVRRRLLASRLLDLQDF